MLAVKTAATNCKVGLRRLHILLKKGLKSTKPLRSAEGIEPLDRARDLRQSRRTTGSSPVKPRLAHLAGRTAGRAAGRSAPSSQAQSSRAGRTVELDERLDERSRFARGMNDPICTLRVPTARDERCCARSHLCSYLEVRWIFAIIRMASIVKELCQYSIVIGGEPVLPILGADIKARMYTSNAVSSKGRVSHWQRGRPLISSAGAPGKSS